MKTKQRHYNLGEIELIGNRLFLTHYLNKGKGQIKLDITPVWHFFKEIEKYIEKPFPKDN